MQIELSVFYSGLGSIAIIMVLGFLLGKFKLVSEQTNETAHEPSSYCFYASRSLFGFPSRIQSRIC